MTLTKPPVKHRPQLPKPADTSAALRAISIMETVVAADAPLSLTAIMAAVELPKPTVHRMIVLLEHAGLLMREPLGKNYSVGLRLARLGREVMLNSNVRATRHIILQRLVTEVGETCNLTMLYEGQVIYIDRVDSAWPLKVDLKPGSLVPLHCSASGKLFMSRMPAAKRRTLLGQLPLARFTDNTITDPKKLKAELDRIRSESVAVDKEEYLDGLVCVAVPVMLGDGRLCASVAVQAPVARLSIARALEYVPLLKRAAEILATTFEAPQ